MRKNYFKSLMYAALLLAAPFVATSCDDVIGQEDNPVASYVQWKTDADKTEIALTIGKTYTRTATAVSSAIIAYESSNTEIATVDPVSGLVTAKKEGSAEISAVVSGMSTTGRSVFQPTKLTYTVKVTDNTAKLARNIDSYVEYTANVDSTFDVSKFFTAYPANESTVTYKLLGANTKDATYGGTNLGTLTDKTFKVGASLVNDKGISDTLYIAAETTGVTSTDYKMPEANPVDTVMIVITKAIAYMNESNERTILTADKYKELDLDATSAIETGTYYVKNGVYNSSKTIDIKGDVTLIFKNGWGSTLQNLDDKTDNATLNIFGEAIPGATAGTYNAWNPDININWWNNVANCITNFKEINIYAGTLNTYGGIIVKDVNVYAGALYANSNWNSKYAMKLSGKLTVNGGIVLAWGQGSDTETSFAVIGDVVLNKGSFRAYNGDYRAVKGSLTAATGFQFLQGDTSDETKATAIEGTTSNSKYIWGQAVPEE